MHRSHRIALAIALLLSPVLLAGSEVARKVVEGRTVENDDATVTAASQIALVAAKLPVWHLHGYLVLAASVAWLGAVVAILTVVAARRPLLSLVGGLLGLAAGAGFALHLGFYTVTLSTLATMPGTDHVAAITAWVAGDADPFGLSMVAFFVVSATAAPLVLVLALWRDRIVPWWAAACVPLQIVLTVETGASPLWGLPWLLLAPPFILTARRLLDPRPASPGERTVRAAGFRRAHSW